MVLPKRTLIQHSQDRPYRSTGKAVTSRSFKLLLSLFSQSLPLHWCEVEQNLGVVRATMEHYLSASIVKIITSKELMDHNRPMSIGFRTYHCHSLFFLTLAASVLIHDICRGLIETHYPTVGQQCPYMASQQSSLYLGVVSLFTMAR
jgi:hypothetical protein